MRFIIAISLAVALSGCRGCNDEEDAPGPTGQADPASAGAESEPGQATAPRMTLPPDQLPGDAPELVVDRLRTGRARWVRISRGGRWVLSYDRDGVLQVFDGARGRLVMERSLLPESPCRSTSLSPDGRRLLVKRGSHVRYINIWTGDELRDFAVSHEGRLRCALSLDGTRVVLADNGRVRVYDPGAEEPLQTLEVPVAKARAVYSDATAATIVVAGDSDKGAAIAAAWGGEGGRRWRLLRDFNPEYPLVMSKTGAWAAGRRTELTAALYNLWTGEAKPYEDERIYGFASHDTRLLAGGAHGRLKILDMETGDELFSIGAFDKLAAVAFSDDAQRVAVVGGDESQHRLGLWIPGERSARFNRNMERLPIYGLAWTNSALTIRARDDRYLFAAGTGRLLDSQKVARTDGLDLDFIDGVRWIGSTVPRFRGRDFVFVHDVTGELKWSQRFRSTVVAAAGTGDGSQVVVLAGRTVAVFGEDGSEGDTWSIAGKGRLAMVTHPRKSEAIVVRSGGEIAGRKIDTGAQVWSAPAPEMKRPRVAVASSGNEIAVASNYRLMIFRRGRSVPEGDFDIDARVTALAISPDGSSAATSDGVDVATWDTKTGERRGSITLLPLGRAVAFGPEGAIFKKGARPFLRWRRGLDHIERGAPELPGIWRAYTGKEFAL